MTRYAIVLGLLLAGSSWSPALGGPIPSPLKGVTISTTVSRDAGTGVFTYQYQIFNPPMNDGQLSSIGIEVSRATGEALLSREGLVNGPRYARHSSEDAFQRVPMVPVGMSDPDGWSSGLGFDDQTPAHGFAGWGAIYERFFILPGQRLEGFQLTSYGLPGIRTSRIRPYLDVDTLPDEIVEAEKTRELRDSLIFHTKAVGPKAPPAQFVPLEFLNYLIALLHDSRQQGWVKVDGIHQSLLAKLLAAKRHLEAGRTEPVRNEVQAFVNEVNGASCRDFSCPGNKPLTSEAFALLFYNGQYFIEQLPTRKTP